jgi:hypothetical protein
MKRRTTLVREITETQARISELRRHQARICEEIEELTSANKANVMALVGDAVGRADFGQVAIDDLLSSISALAESVANRSGSTAPSDGAETFQAFVRLSRNASTSNCAALKAAGLHWHGRSAGWTGCVSRAQLAELRRVFGKRVEKPEDVDVGEDVGSSLEGAQGAVSADVEAIAVPVEAEQGQTNVAAPPASAATMTMMRSPFGGFPARRSVT